MAKIKTTFICTVLNEEKTIGALLDSIKKQTVLPDEIIIVDGGSTDKTLSAISNFQFPISNKFPKLKIIKKTGNRALGRNEAIKNAKGEIILCSDAGCELDKEWVAQLTRSFTRGVDVVSGYYKGMPSSNFQKNLVPYVLVMEDKVDEDNFLPAARSMAFTKKIWEKIGGFPQKHSFNEDYVFAKKLQEIKAKIAFNKKALVYWIPPDSVEASFNMFYKFAYGDAHAGIIRPKVILIFVRYMAGVYIALQSLFVASVLLLAYIMWAIVKNYKYVRESDAIIYLPVLQFVSDIAVLLGTTVGLLKRVFSRYT